VQNTIVRMLTVAVVLSPAVVLTQTGTNPKAATYITKEEVDIVNKQPGTDRTIRVMDIGSENFSVGIIHRGASGAGAARGAAAGGGAAAAAGAGANAGAGAGGGRAGGGAGAGAAGGGRAGGGGGAAAAGGAGRGAAPAAEPCGERSTTPNPPGTPNGLYHESQTEGYLIVSGAGTVVTGGHIVNGSKSGPTAEVTTTLNGPSCSGAIMGADVVQKYVKEGDIIIIPAGVPHGWGTIPDHVDYLSFRPSARVLTAGYEHPSIKK
jgi:mannose-6-phosphate isomerase-like protein (cupin superfamily)